RRPHARPALHALPHQAEEHGSGSGAVVRNLPPPLQPGGKGVKPVTPRRSCIRLAILAVAGLIAAAPSLPASAADGSSDVGCSTGSSSYIELQKIIPFRANYSPRPNNI